MVEKLTYQKPSRTDRQIITKLEKIGATGDLGHWYAILHVLYDKETFIPTAGFVELQGKNASVELLPAVKGKVIPIISSEVKRLHLVHSKINAEVGSTRKPWFNRFYPAYMGERRANDG